MCFFLLQITVCMFIGIIKMLLNHWKHHQVVMSLVLFCIIKLKNHVNEVKIGKETLHVTPNFFSQ
jgi:hypothetical protein